MNIFTIYSSVQSITNKFTRPIQCEEIISGKQKKSIVAAGATTGATNRSILQHHDCS